MQITNLLEYSTRAQLRQWLAENHLTAKECWVTTSRSKTPREDAVPYVDAVEEALCFGWIDSTCKRLPDGRLAQRLSPRRKGPLDRAEHRPLSPPDVGRTNDGGRDTSNAKINYYEQSFFLSYYYPLPRRH